MNASASDTSIASVKESEEALIVARTAIVRGVQIGTGSVIGKGIEIKTVRQCQIAVIGTGTENAIVIAVTRDDLALGIANAGNALEAVIESVLVGVKTGWTFPLLRLKTIMQSLPGTNESEKRIGTIKTKIVVSDVIEIKIAVKTAIRIGSVNGLVGVDPVIAVIKTKNVNRAETIPVKTAWNRFVSRKNHQMNTKIILLMMNTKNTTTTILIT